MTKHTPAPWKVYKDAVHPVLEHGGNGNNGYAICGEIYGVDAPFNACLIAAAPELLDLLQDILNENNKNELIRNVYLGKEMHSRIIEIIAKAKGE